MNKNFLAQVPPIENPFISKTEGSYAELSKNTLGPLIARLWWTIVILGALALLVFLIWGGVDLLTSEGDQEKYKNARDKITHALMGMGILAASFAVIKLISIIFQVDILNLEWPTPSP